MIFVESLRDDAAVLVRSTGRLGMLYFAPASAGSRLPASASAIAACSRFVAAAALNIGAINAVAMWLGTFGRQPA